MSRHLLWLGFPVFVMLATANGAGYRYGVSDQAFYIPVVLRAIDGTAFPRDAALIDAQGRLMLADELIAGLIASTGLSLETLFLAAHVLALALVWTGLVLIGRRFYASPWLTVALAAAFTLRHRIPHTSANSFEPYFHPRMLAFGLGLVAVAAMLRRRFWTAVALVGVAALVHVTTALWFAVLLGVAMTVLDLRMRRLGLAGAAGAAAVLAWAALAGPLADTMARMDATWLQAVATKDLFPSDWPVWAWSANLALPALVWWAHRRRVRAGIAVPEEAGLVWGAAALAALFLVTLPLVETAWALPVQLQISRIFWLLDLLALVYLLGLVRRERVAVALAAAAVTLAVARGTYIMTVEYPERPLFAVRLPDTPWEQAMDWVERQPPDVHVLADPGHAWKHGSSVRVSAERDVLLEEVKDSALSMYDEDVARRYVERVDAVGDFAALTPARVRQLAARYDLDLVVTERDLPLPLAYRNEQFRIYRLDGG